VSTLGVAGRSLDQSHALDPSREVGRPETGCSEGGSHSLGCATCENIKEPGFWGCCVWRVDNERDIPPCGLITSALGWLVVERK
jgi:hypothetical protein